VVDLPAVQSRRADHHRYFVSSGRQQDLLPVVLVDASVLEVADEEVKPAEGQDVDDFGAWQLEKCSQNRTGVDQSS
jgi:hypothetical protein